MAVLQAVVSEKHILQLKFQQKLPIDKQNIKKKVKEEIYQSLAKLLIIYPVFNVADPFISCNHMKMKYKVLSYH